MTSASTGRTPALGKLPPPALSSASASAPLVSPPATRLSQLPVTRFGIVSPGSFCLRAVHRVVMPGYARFKPIRAGSAVLAATTLIVKVIAHGPPRQASEHRPPSSCHDDTDLSPNVRVTSGGRRSCCHLGARWRVKGCVG